MIIGGSEGGDGYALSWLQPSLKRHRASGLCVNVQSEDIRSRVMAYHVEQSAMPANSHAVQAVDLSIRSRACSFHLEVLPLDLDSSHEFLEPLFSTDVLEERVIFVEKGVIYEPRIYRLFQPV